MRFKTLAALFAAVAAVPAQAAWREASSDHFVIYSQDNAKLLEAFATKLEKFDRAMRVMRGLDDPPLGPANRLTVFVVSGIPAVQKLYGKGGGNVGGFYIGRASGSIAFTPRAGGFSGDGDSEAELTLLHEYGHHFMFQNFPGAIPAWLVEGYAEFHSTARFDKDGSVGLGLPAQHRAYSLILGEHVPLEKLLNSSVAQLPRAEVEQLYARGWLLTHYLIYETTRAGQLKTYLGEINKGTPAADAAKRAFGDLKLLDRELDRYLRQKKLSYNKVAAERVPVGAIHIRELSPAEASVISVRMRSKRGVDAATAKAVLAEARDAAKPYPDDVLAQVTLAEAEYDAGNAAEAIAAAERALKTDPKSVEALIYRGRAAMALAAKSDKADAATWKAVRKWFLTANRVDPLDPEPLILFYNSFLAEGVAPTPNAALGLDKALELAPQDDSLRWLVGSQHLHDGKATEARAALAPIAFSPHGGEQAKAAAAILAKLDAGGTAAALEAMEAQSAATKEE